MNTAIRIGVVFGLALFYALVIRLAFSFGPYTGYASIVSWSFIILLPVSFGALTTFLGYKIFGRSGFWIFGAPVLVGFFGMMGSIITHLEATLCVLVAAPIMLPFSLVGGLIMSWILSKGNGRLQISFLVLLPLAAAPLENLWEQPHEQVSIVDTIDIDASAEIIWKQIASVPSINRDQIPFKLIYLLDFPRPIAAIIDREGVGARRQATFERGVSFFETVTEWEPYRRLSFTIAADPAFIPHTAFDQHIIVGGRFYDVLDGCYEIQPNGRGCRLVLTSTHRLSTPFNFYAGLWSRWVMNQIQGSILTVIKERAEAS